EAIASRAELRDVIEIVGLVDIDRGTAEARATAHGMSGLPIRTELAPLLAELKPDLLFDVVPPAARRAVVETGLAHGCHVLSEKPMALSLADAQALVKRAAEAGRVHAIVQNRRFNAGVRRIRATLESGALG